MDIDMSGGTMATFEFVGKQNLDEVRDQLEKAFPGGVSLERLTLQGEEKEAGKRFRIRTSEIDRAKVIAGINKAFEDPKFAVVRVYVKDFKITRPLVSWKETSRDFPMVSRPKWS